MTMITAIDELISLPEGKTLEFKRDLSSPGNIIKTLVAFANTAGGRLILGVEDESRFPVGVGNPLDEEERVCNLIADTIEPRLVPNVEMVTIDSKTLLMVEVFLSGLRPHRVKSEGQAGVYVRLGSTNRQADRELIGELKRSAEGIVFDELPLPDLTPDSLDLEPARALLSHKRRLDNEALLTLKILAREQGRLVPTIGGLLLFGGKTREMRFSDAWIQCGRFMGTDKADILDHMEINEHLPVAVERVIDFLKKHAMRGADFSEIRRKDVWSIPLSIIREVVINAIVHADYSQIGAPIRVAFFDDRIEVENPGILLPGLTMEDICQGVSKLRNRVIARVFRELDLMEQWGSGIPRIFKEADVLGLPAPKIMEIGMRVRFIIYLAEPKATFPRQVDEHNAYIGTMSALSRHQVEILKKCEKESPIGDLMRLIERRDRTKFRNSLLNPLRDAGLIEMTIPDKPRSSKQKYRLTDKGRDVLDAENKKDNPLS